MKHRVSMTSARQSWLLVAHTVKFELLPKKVNPALNMQRDNANTN